MKIQRTKCVEYEIEGFCIIKIRTKGWAGMGFYEPAGEWKLYKNYNEDTELAKKELKELKENKAMCYYDIEIDYLTEEEINLLPKM